MPLSRSFSINVLFAVSILLFSLSFSTVNAEDLKDVTQQPGQVQQATAFDRINAHLNANPKDLQAMFIRAVMLAEQNRRDEAIKAFTEITEKYPNLPEPFNNLAVLYADQGQYDKAKKALESAIKTHPSYATAHENLGDIYAKMASESYDKALQLDNSNTRAQGKLSMIKDIFIAGNKPPMLTNKLPETGKDVSKPPVAVTPAPATVTPTPAVKPIEPKPVIAEKPVEAEKPASKDDDSKTISNVVTRWAKAWSSKDVDDYLASYANSFQPPKGQSRKEWEQSRRERINKPVNIHVDISNLRVIMNDSSHAKASFKQSYRAGSLSQRTSKTLMMVKSNGKWLIEQEETSR
ncbi:MAG TPA: tetratricopeptide repeat protein [Methylophilaceae bacterium]|nr:tetratricopeptide repeat protein [Methylophilaceae bacterium]